MTLHGNLDLRSFADGIRTTDDHAAHHLRLLDEVDRALREAAPGGDVRRTALAAKLERWRYQHLNEHAAALTARDESLVDALDLAANALAGRPPRPPRATRHAVRDPRLETGSIAEAIAAWEQGLPLDELARRAAS